MIRILDSIHFAPNLDELRASLHIDSYNEDYESVVDFLKKAPVPNPKAVYAACHIDRIDVSSVVIDGVLFDSAFLAHQLKNQTEVFPYIATCGAEIYEWVQKIDDPYVKWWGEELMLQALRKATEDLVSDFRLNTYAGPVGKMNPGSLESWNLSQQEPLFRLFGDSISKIGVTLTPSWLMIPNKTVSGLWYPDSSEYVNCKLCPRKNCGNRITQFDENLSQSLFKKDDTSNVDGIF